MKNKGWQGWDTYISVGLLSLVYIAFAVFIGLFLFDLWRQAPLVLSIVVTVIVSIIPIGYFVVHVLGVKVD